MIFNTARSPEPGARSGWSVCSQLRAPSSGLATIAFLSFCVVTQCGFSFLSDLQNEKGNEQYKKGQVGKARSSYQSALKSDPKSPEIAYNLGNALYKENSFKESLAAYEKAARVPREPKFQSKAFYNLGNSLYRNQDLPKAVEFYKQALRLNPKDEDAKYNLELLLKKMDKDEKKDDQKQDQKEQPKDKDQQDQDKPQPNKEDQGGQGGQGSQDEKSKNEQGQGQGQEGKKEEQKKSEGSEEQGQGQDQKQEQQQQQQEGQQSQPQNAQQEGEEKEKIPAEVGEGPKSDADLRAEQILSALENQEQQVLKFQNDPNNPQVRGRRVAEKDW